MLRLEHTKLDADPGTTHKLFHPPIYSFTLFPWLNPFRHSIIILNVFSLESSPLPLYSLLHNTYQYLLFFLDIYFISLFITGTRICLSQSPAPRILSWEHLLLEKQLIVLPPFSSNYVKLNMWKLLKDSTITHAFFFFYFIPIKLHHSLELWYVCLWVHFEIKKKKTKTHLSFFN